MKIVNQRDFLKGDCGISCISTITQIDYTIVKSAFIEENIFTENGPYYTTHSDIIKILSKLGYQTQRKKFKRWDEVLGTSIVKVNPSNDGLYWHWVVYYKDNRDSKGVILDPKPHFQEPIVHYRGRRGSGQYILVSIIK